MMKRRLDDERIFVIDAFLTEEECESFIARSENQGYDEATISTSAGAVVDKEIRNNRRLIADDVALARELWDRARGLIPVTLGSWRAVGLNERFRFYRYDPGQMFAPHYDGCFKRSETDLSQFTLMIYLNSGFDGGETHFYDADLQLRATVRPETGMALVFRHAQLHEGAPVVFGQKYVLRTDVMYTLDLSGPTIDAAVL